MELSCVFFLSRVQKYVFLTRPGNSDSTPSSPSSPANEFRHKRAKRHFSPLFLFRLAKHCCPHGGGGVIVVYVVVHTIVHCPRLVHKTAIHAFSALGLPSSSSSSTKLSDITLTEAIDGCSLDCTFATDLTSSVQDRYLKSSWRYICAQ